MHVHTKELVKQCFEWQKANMNAGSWSKEVKQELDGTGLAFVWLN